MAEPNVQEHKEAQDEKEKKEPKLKVLQEGECCEPDCGPTTCEPVAEVKAEEEPKKKSGCGCS